MEWPATERYDLEPAPGTLGLVGDLLNTGAAGTPPSADLLASTASANAWADEAMAVWARARGLAAVALDLTDQDVMRLRELRAHVHRSSAAIPDDGDPPGVLAFSMTLRAEFDAHAGLSIEPAGAGWRPLASAVALELVVAETLDTRRRLKVCRNPRCAVAFYDRSRNCSGVWHSSSTCGNAENLRASRARRRHDTSTAGESAR